MDQSELTMKRPRERPLYKPLRKAEEANFKANFSFFTSLSTAEARVFGVKFIGLYETVGFIGETGRNLNTRLTEHKQATRNGDANNPIAVHHQLTNHNIDWDSAQCLTYSTYYFQRLTLESWYTNLEQTPTTTGALQTTYP